MKLKELFLMPTSLKNSLYDLILLLQKNIVLIKNTIYK